MTKPVPVKFKNDRHSGSITLEFLTPMFGGGFDSHTSEGAQHKPIDSVTPVRVASIRGQLRHWWRATSGAWCQSPEEMKARETQIFGAASTPGDLSLSVKAIDLRSFEVAVYGLKPNNRNDAMNAFVLNNKNGLAYGAFPLSPGNDERQAKGLKLKAGTLNELKGKFELTWSCDSTFKEEVQLAVDAWIAFGGLGGRTTRGFGQLSSNRSLVESVLKRVNSKGKPRLGKEIPALDPQKVLHVKPSSNSKGVELLNVALDMLMTFRQGEETARNKGKEHNRPGRSRWPEPDAIRSITGDWAENHEPDTKYGHIQKFPRAAFGLPIIFHFQNPTKKEPKDSTLQPVGKERMRSPLQIALTSDGTIIFAVLTAPRPDKVELKGLQKVEHSLSQDERALLAARAPDVFKDVDPLKAFLKFVISSVDSRNIIIQPEF